MLPYATLSLAKLHFKLNHYQHALNAVLEAVRIAQEKNDDECLAHILSWLYRIVYANETEHSLHPVETLLFKTFFYFFSYFFCIKGDKEEMLKRAIGRAIDFNMGQIAALNSFGLANHYLHHPPHTGVGLTYGARSRLDLIFFLKREKVLTPKTKYGRMSTTVLALV